MWYKGLWWLYPNSKAVVHPSYPEGVGGVYENKCLPFTLSMLSGHVFSRGERGGSDCVFWGGNIVNPCVFSSSGTRTYSYTPVSMDKSVPIPSLVDGY